MVRMHKACRNYGDWKAQHLPHRKPWLFPQQITLPQLNPADVGRWDLSALPDVDERDITEVAAVSAAADEDDTSASGGLLASLSNVFMGSASSALLGTATTTTSNPQVVSASSAGAAAGQVTSDNQRGTVEHVTPGVAVVESADPSAAKVPVAASAH